MLIRFAPAAALMLLALPVLFGLAGTVLPAFGYLPVLGGTDLGLSHFSALAAMPGITRSAIHALVIGFVSTLASLLLVAGFVAAWHGTRMFARVQHLVSPLLAVPHAAAAFGFAFLIAPSGFIARAISPWLTGWERPPDALIVNDPAGLALIAGLIIKETPFLLLVALAALPQVPATRATRLSLSLGYGRMGGFLLTVWPPVYRQIRLAVFAVIAYASANVDMALILGPTLPPTLPVRLVEWMNDPDLSMRFVACAGACLQIVITAGAIVLWIALERLAAAARDRVATAGLRFQRDRLLRMLSLGAMALSALTVFTGLFLLGLWSIGGLWSFPDTLPRSITLRGWESAMPALGAPLQTTILVALASTVLSVVMVIACLTREQETGRTGGQRALALLYLPLVVPQIGFLFGLQLLVLSAGADASLASLVLAHMVFVLPYVFLSLSAPWRAFDKRFEAVAAGLGASRRKVLWQVRFPMLLRAVLAASAVGLAVSIGQYLPTLLIGGGRFSTITTEAVALGSGGNRRVVGVYAFLQMLLPFIGFALATIIPALLFRNRRAISGA